MTDLFDQRGTKLEVGQRVAFNYQGTVGVGYIDSFKDVIKYGRPRTYILVRRLYPRERGRLQSKLVSTVTSPANLIVIFEDLAW